jgi:hypothetical protein
VFTYKDNFKIDLGEISCDDVNCIDVIHDRVHWILLPRLNLLIP